MDLHDIQMMRSEGCFVILARKEDTSRRTIRRSSLTLGTISDGRKKTQISVGKIEVGEIFGLIFDCFETKIFECAGFPFMFAFLSASSAAMNPSMRSSNSLKC